MRGLLAGGGPCFLLESVEGGDRVARWSFLGASPSGEISGRETDPFAALRALPRDETVTGGDDLPPFTGGAVGYVGYDAVRRLERLPDANPDPIGLPDAWFGIFDAVIAFDHVRHRLLFVTHASNGDEAAARARLSALEERALTRSGETRPEAPLPLTFEESLPRSSFVAAVERAKEHIRAGDVFQVVLSRRWSAPFSGDPFAVYRALRSLSPSPYQYYLRTPHGAIFGASPERLVHVAAGARGDDGRDDPARRDAAAGRDARGGPRLREGAARRPEGARRARHARGPRAERPRPGREGGQHSGEGFLPRRALLARHAHRLARDGSPRARQGRRGRAHGDVSRGHAHRGAEDTRDGDHRGSRAGEARRLRRRRGLPRFRRQPRRRDRDSHGGRGERHAARAGRRRHRRGLGPRGRGHRVREQGARPHARRRESGEYR